MHKSLPKILPLRPKERTKSLDNEAKRNFVKPIVYRKLPCSFRTIIRIILSDFPFEKTLQEMYYGVRALFPYYENAAANFTVQILLGHVSHHADVIVVESSAKMGLEKRKYTLKRDVAFSYKIVEVIGPNRNLEQFTKLDEGRFRKLLHREPRPMSNKPSRKDNIISHIKNGNLNKDKNEKENNTLEKSRHSKKLKLPHRNRMLQNANRNNKDLHKIKKSESIQAIQKNVSGDRPSFENTKNNDRLIARQASTRNKEKPTSMQYRPSTDSFHLDRVCGKEIQGSTKFDLDLNQNCKEFPAGNSDNFNVSGPRPNQVPLKYVKSKKHNNDDVQENRQNYKKAKLNHSNLFPNTKFHKSFKVTEGSDTDPKSKLGLVIPKNSINYKKNMSNDFIDHSDAEIFEQTQTVPDSPGFHGSSNNYHHSVVGDSENHIVNKEFLSIDESSRPKQLPQSREKISQIFRGRKDSFIKLNNETKKCNDSHKKIPLQIVGFQTEKDKIKNHKNESENDVSKIRKDVGLNKKENSVILTEIVNKKNCGNQLVKYGHVNKIEKSVKNTEINTEKSEPLSDKSENNPKISDTHPVMSETHAEKSKNQIEKSESPSVKFQIPCEKFKTPTEKLKIIRDEFETPSENSEINIEMSQSPTENFESPTENFESPTENCESLTENCESLTENFESPTENYESLTENFESPTENYEYPTENYESPTENYESPTENYESPTENYKSPTENYESPTENFESPTENYEFLTENFESLAENFESLAENFESHTENCEPLTENYESLTENYGSPTENSTSHTENSTSHTENATSHTENSTSHTEKSTSHTEKSTSHTENSTSHTENSTSHTENSTSHTGNSTPHTENSTSLTENSTPHTENSTSNTEKSKTLTENNLKKTGKDAEKPSIEADVTFNRIKKSTSHKEKSIYINECYKLEMLGLDNRRNQSQQGVIEFSNLMTEDSNTNSEFLSMPYIGIALHESIPECANFTSISNSSSAKTVCLSSKNNEPNDEAPELSAQLQDVDMLDLLIDENIEPIECSNISRDNSLFSGSLNNMSIEECETANQILTQKACIGLLTDDCEKENTNLTKPLLSTTQDCKFVNNFDPIEIREIANVEMTMKNGTVQCNDTMSLPIIPHCSDSSFMSDKLSSLSSPNTSAKVKRWKKNSVENTINKVVTKSYELFLNREKWRKSIDQSIKTVIVESKAYSKATEMEERLPVAAQYEEICGKGYINDADSHTSEIELNRAKGRNNDTNDNKISSELPSLLMSLDVSTITPIETRPIAVLGNGLEKKCDSTSVINSSFSEISNNLADVPRIVLPANSNGDLHSLLNLLNDENSSISKQLSQFYPESKARSRTSSSDRFYVEEDVEEDIEEDGQLIIDTSLSEDSSRECTPTPSHSFPKENISVNKLGLGNDILANKKLICETTRSNIRATTKEPILEKETPKKIMIATPEQLNKPFIDIHIKKLKESYSWLIYDYKEGSILCDSCKLDVSNYVFQIGTVILKDDVGNVKLQKLAKICSEHSTSNFHSLTDILKKNSLFVKAIRFLLMFCLQHINSFEELLFEMRSRLKEYGNSVNDDMLIMLINIIKVSNEYQLLGLIRQHHLPVSFVLDFCKRIAIIRFVLYTGEPVEYGLSIGKSMKRSPSLFFRSIDISESQIVYFKVFDRCGGQCSSCTEPSDDILVKINPQLLPVRFPASVELLNILRDDKLLHDVFNFSKVITRLYLDFPQYFSIVDGVHVLQYSHVWPAIELVVKEHKKLQEVCCKIYERIGNLEALALSKITLKIDEKLQKSLDMVKLVCSSVENLQKECELEVSFSFKLVQNFQRISHSIVINNEIEENIKCHLSNFVKENSLSTYCFGRVYLNDFDFLNYPSSLMNLGDTSKSLENFIRIHSICRKFMSEEPRKILVDLQSFGKFLFDNFPQYHMPLTCILKVFQTHEKARLDYPLSLAVYNIVGTLPFYSAPIQRSMYQMWDTYCKFCRKFGNTVSFDLTLIHFQEPNCVEMLKLYKCETQS